MDLIIKASALGITAALLGLVIKKQVPELSLLLSCAACMVIFYLFFSELSEILNFIKQLSEAAGLSSSLISPVFKSVMLCLTARFASSVCRDAQQNSIAEILEFAAALTSLYISLPLIETVFHMISSLI